MWKSSGSRREYDGKQHEIKLLERQLAAEMVAKPADELLNTYNSVTEALDGLTGAELVSKRAWIAATLPSFLSEIRFKPNGTFIAKRSTGLCLPFIFVPSHH